MSINSVVLSGNLTRNAELKMGASAVLSFCIAVNERVKDAGGAWGDRANFIDCVMFGTRAEKLEQYLLKGLKVTVSGRLRQNTWETKDGTKRSKLEVYVSDLEFMSRKDGTYGAPPRARKHEAEDIYDDDIPF